MSAYIRKGYGFDVQFDFARAQEDIPIELAPTEYAKPGCIIGYIKGQPDSPLGFMRRDRIRVNVNKSAIGGLS